jgi:hypothetical protein
MRKSFTVFAMATLLLLAGSFAWKAEAAPLSGVADLPPLTKSTSPLEGVACWCGPYRCACRRRYWGPRYGYYGYRYRPYGYYGYGRRWRY